MIKKLADKMSTRKLIDVAYKCIIATIVCMLLLIVFLVICNPLADVFFVTSILLAILSVRLGKEVDKRKREDD